jgi:hypothetical protein
LRKELGGLSVDLAFVDGMHLFEYALRDFINLERACDRESVILVDDCCPSEAASASREAGTMLWSGDVWKLILCLRTFRPDLKVATVDLPPGGLGVVTGLNPASTVLSDRYEEICERYMPMGFDEVSKAECLRPLAGNWNAIRGLLPSEAFRRADAAKLCELRDRRRPSLVIVGRRIVAWLAPKRRFAGTRLWAEVRPARDWWRSRASR